jgi:hypothetical protein
MMSVIYPTKAAALAAISARDSALGYPATSQGIQVGSGRFVSSITTSSCAAPVQLSSGSFAVPGERLGVVSGLVNVPMSDVAVAQIGG